MNGNVLSFVFMRLIGPEKKDFCDGGETGSVRTRNILK